MRSYLFTWRKKFGEPLYVDDWLPFHELLADVIKDKVRGKDNPYPHHALNAFLLRARMNPDRPAAKVNWSHDYELTREALQDYLRTMSETDAAAWLRQAAI